MRFLALVSVITSIIALVLSVVLIVAGEHTSFLEEYNIITFNATDVGRTLATSPSSPLYSVINDNPTVASLLKAVPTASAIASEIGNLGETVAEDIGLHDWYSLHILNYCEGSFAPNAMAADATKNVTRCSDASAFWNFNLTQVLQSELKPGITLSMLNFPANINSEFDTIETVLRVMLGLYAATAGVAGVGVLTGIAACLLDGRGSACLNIIWSTINVVIAVGASVVSTIIMGVAESAVNASNNEFGLVATKGTKFLEVTWAMVAVLIIGWLVWIIDCCVGGSRRRNNFGGKSNRFRRNYAYEPAYKEVH